MNQVLLKIGGAFNLLCAALHVLFPYIFKWNEGLSCLAEKNVVTVGGSLYIMNYCLLVFWVILACIALFGTDELIRTRIGKMLMTGMVMFWVIRILILQPLYVGWGYPGSWPMIGLFMAGMLLFAVPWVTAVVVPKIKRA